MLKYLPYLKVNVDVQETKFGFKEIPGLDSLFNGFQARDKVLCKSDMLLSMSDLFTETTLSKYREIIYAVVTGRVQEATQLSSLLTALYVDDEKFKEYVATMYYLDESTVPFGIQIIQSLVSKVNDTEYKWKEHFKKTGSKVFVVANCCMYYAVDDVNTTVLLPANCKCEVLSNAKNWKGNTSR